MKVKFYLKRPKADTPTSIYALVNYSGISLKIYTPESIDPQFWNSKANGAKNTFKFKEHAEFNQRLNNIRTTINKVFMDFQNENNHEIPSAAVLKELIEQALNKEDTKLTFLEFFDDFVQRSLKGQRLDPRSKQPIRHGVAKGYKTTYTLLLEFNKEWSRLREASRKAARKLDFDTIDLGFHEDFSKFLTDKDFSINYIGTHIKRIKTVMAEASRKKLNTNFEYTSNHFIKTSEEADTIYLNEMELSDLQSIDLEGDDKLENVRDLFLIGCFTGLRFSDFSALKKENIADGFIRIKQIKTGDPVIIPVHPIVKGILNKLNGELPKSISNVKLNLYIKELCAKADSLKKIEAKTITKGGVKKTLSQAKYDLVTTHTARRSFATNEYIAGTPTITIMAITGHKTEKAFLKYIRVTKEEHAVIMKGIWDKRNNLKAV